MRTPNYTERLSIDQRRQIAEEMRNPSPWAKARAAKQKRRKSSGLTGPILTGSIYAHPLGRHEKAFCVGSKQHKKSGCVKARWRSIDGLLLCHKCWKRHRREWLKSQPLCVITKNTLTEAERRKAIFAQWKDKELDKLRRTPEYQAWRVAVLERDGYACQHCCKVGGKLHAHHIRTFKMHPESRYDVDNGITLCRKCHEDLHIARFDAAKVLKFQA